MKENKHSKLLVNSYLLRYQSSIKDLDTALKGLSSTSRNIKDVMKREELIKNKFKTYNSKIYFSQVKANFSLEVAYMIICDEDRQDSPLQSKADKKKAKKAQRENNQRLHHLGNQFYNVFFVKDINSNDLLIFMCDPNPKNKGDIFKSYSIANIKRHCLERIVERLGLESIEEALDEIASSLQWLESSTKELLVRSCLDMSDTFDRHIPTKNGALLLRNYLEERKDGQPALEGHLITWIHKKQFFNGQEVERNDFNFVQDVNALLSSQNKTDEIIKIKNAVNSLEKDLKKEESIIVSINGFYYPYEKYIGALEDGKYLDYIIKFNK